MSTIVERVTRALFLFVCIYSNNGLAGGGDPIAKDVIGLLSPPEQDARVGAQTGGRVFLFLFTDDFRRDYDRYRASGVEFVRPPKDEPYGTVAVFRDLYGNLWDLVQRRN